MTEQLLTAQTVIRFGRERAQHDWKVEVVGDDATGYRCQVQTKCGRIVEHETTTRAQGFVTCTECAPSPPCTPHRPAKTRTAGALNAAFTSPAEGSA